MKDDETVKLTVDQIIGPITGSPPSDMNTLQKISASLGDDPDYAGTIATALAGKSAAADTNINALTAKVTPADADEMRIADSAASFGFKKLSLANLKAWVLSLLPVTKYFESAEQTITPSGSLTLAHGLGVEPKFVQFYLICKTAELGYSVGSKVPFGTQIFTNSVTSTTSFTSVVDATNVSVRFSSGGFVIPNFTTGVYGTITNGNWRLIARAMA
ncbi:MAG: hypothetical protein ACK4SQ_14195 [Allorhizobium sp.]